MYLLAFRSAGQGSEQPRDCAVLHSTCVVSGKSLVCIPHPSSQHQQYILEDTQQLNTIIFLLNKVLWSLRFDEGKYAQENTPTIENKFAQPGNARVKSINMSEWYGLLRINCR